MSGESRILLDGIMVCGVMEHDIMVYGIMEHGIMVYGVMEHGIMVYGISAFSHFCLISNINYILM
jgi:hypothetical protein